MKKSSNDWRSCQWQLPNSTEYDFMHGTEQLYSATNAYAQSTGGRLDLDENQSIPIRTALVISLGTTFGLPYSSAPSMPHALSRNTGSYTFHCNYNLLMWKQVRSLREQHRTIFRFKTGATCVYFAPIFPVETHTMHTKVKNYKKSTAMMSNEREI